MLACLILLNLHTLFWDHGGEDRLRLFFEKVETLKEQFIPPKNRNTIPNFSPGSPQNNMPIDGGYMIDDQTQLHYSLVEAKIYDPELGIALDLRKGIVYDAESGKTYRTDGLSRERPKRKVGQR